MEGGLFVLFAGYIIGLGAVTVIDLHGFLARKSSYWTLATTRTHKVTKPLIWLGIFLALLGGFSVFESTDLYVRELLFIAGILILNGFYLSFVISPFLLKQEKTGKQTKLLPAKLQRRITLSFLISFCGWWGSLWLIINSLF